jgi:hypothetical protein
MLEPTLQERTLHKATICIIFSTGYARAGKILYDLALQGFDSGSDYYPIWGTCLGFELVALLSIDGQENLGTNSKNFFSS